jgi:hypothetical protein
MDTVCLAAPFAVRATPRTRTLTTSTSPAADGGAYRRLLHVLAGPANTAPFCRPPNLQPQDPRRHRPSTPTADRPE